MTDTRPQPLTEDDAAVHEALQYITAVFRGTVAFDEPRLKAANRTVSAWIRRREAELRASKQAFKTARASNMSPRSDKPA